MDDEFDDKGWDGDMGDGEVSNMNNKEFTYSV
jgi:hypothetical protein